MYRLIAVISLLAVLCIVYGSVSVCCIAGALSRLLTQSLSERTEPLDDINLSQWIRFIELLNVVIDRIKLRFYYFYPSLVSAIGYSSYYI
jgi:hypothetical protein